ncbi:type IX secretion system membrane protein PorP/SprF [Daejeonella sp.]|uniref:PorP/SprF family type IX secretion system membrane protein n=1 Tax=Daejeonella sp. TaxID=2805397 RepID=UPI0030C4CD6F
MKIVALFTLSILLLTAFSFQLSAQQLPLYSQYMFNTLEINPAYAGFKESMQFTTIFRKQFNGIKNSPQTAMISFDMPIGRTKLGVGVKLVDDKFSVSRTTGAQGSLSYHIDGDNSKLSFGMQIGALNYKANMMDLNLTNPGDPIFAQDVNTLVANFGTGIFYNTDKYYAGISVPNLARTNLRETNVALDSYDVKQSPHFYVNAGMLIDLNDNFILKPSFLLRGVRGIPLNYDVNANVFFKELFSVGVSYRSNSAVVGLMDVRIIPDLRLGYAYDYDVGRLNTFTKSTHEIILRYSIPLERNVLMPSYLF